MVGTLAEAVQDTHAPARLGGGKVTIYHRGKPVLRHIPDTEAIDELLELIEANGSEA